MPVDIAIDLEVGAEFGVLDDEVADAVVLIVVFVWREEQVLLALSACPSEPLSRVGPLISLFYIFFLQLPVLGHGIGPKVNRYFMKRSSLRVDLVLYFGLERLEQDRIYASVYLYVFFNVKLFLVDIVVI